MNLVALPFLLPLLTAVVCLIWRRPSPSRRWLALGGTATQVLVGVQLVGSAVAEGPRVMLMGNWVAPLGIALVVDVLAAVMVVFAAVVWLACLVFFYAEVPADREHPLRLPLLGFLMAGVNLAFTTGDIFNLYVAFELMLVSSYALLTLEADNWDIQHAWPFVALNVLGSTLFLCAAGFVYAMFGSLNFADLARRMAGQGGDVRVQAVGLLFLVVFGIKAGAFPLNYWLPNSYPTLPVSLAALYGGLLTKVGVYVIMRVFGTVFPADLGMVGPCLAWLGLVTAILGGMGAISRPFIRGILSYHILSQVGLMLVGVSFFNRGGYLAALYILLHNMAVKSSLFLIGGAAAWMNGTDNLARMGSLWKKAPWLGVLFLVQALALAGLPPLSGFWGKYALITTAFAAHAYWLGGLALAVGLLTLLSMLKIWNAAFWRTDDACPVAAPVLRWWQMVFAAALLTLVAIGLGLGVGLFQPLLQQAVDTTLDRNDYIEAVLWHTGKGSAF